MSQLDFARTAACCEQVYLIEPDAGLLCRILGLYAARSMDVLHVDYAQAAQQVMQLRVTAAARAGDTGDVADAARVLIARASTFVGVIAAAQPSCRRGVGDEHLPEPPAARGARQTQPAT